MLHRRAQQDQRGQATLIGLLAVILIIAILASMYYPRIAAEHSQPGGPPTPRERAYGANCDLYAGQINDAIVMYETDRGHRPRNLNDLRPYGVDDSLINAPGCYFQINPNTGQVQDYGHGQARPVAAAPSGYPAQPPSQSYGNPAQRPAQGYGYQSQPPGYGSQPLTSSPSSDDDTDPDTSHDVDGSAARIRIPQPPAASEFHKIDVSYGVQYAGCLKKILIANRGDIAVRVIRAAREMRIPTVAVYSQADAQSLPVRLADEAVCIGPPDSKGSYLNAPNILSAAVITGCDAIHPGIGFLSETATFAEMCGAIGLKFIGPPVRAIEIMGDKIQARATMEKAGVPIVPGTNVPLRDPVEAAKIASRIGFPVMIKAAGGGGGRGIRIVQNEQEFPSILKTAQMEAESSFGNADVYIEKYIDTFRHIEVQVLADEHGSVIHLGERDCSLQTQRYQKMVEEAPAANLSPAVRNRICDAAVKAARAAGYANAGTIEFIVTPEGKFYFMEMNTRLQIEHPITEMVTGTDLVKWQIRVAAGERLKLSQRQVKWTGHSIEVRITARDPERDFAPSAGRITSLHLPGGLGVRVDSHIYESYDVPPYYDSMLAKIITWDADRAGAIARMERALAETEIGGIKTDLAYHRRIMANAFFRKGDISTKFLARHLGDS